MQVYHTAFQLKWLSSLDAATYRQVTVKLSYV
jgi:hypothetical protein